MAFEFPLSLKPPPTSDFRLKKWMEQVTNRILGSSTYSLTEEINTYLRHTDGKHIYRSSYETGTLPNNTTDSTAHGLGSSVTFVRMYGTANNGSNYVPIPYSGTTTTIQLQVDGTNIKLTTDVDFTAYSGFVTLEYTKS